MQRRIREIKPAEFDLVIHYFVDAGDDFLRGMGVEKSKLPSAESWRLMLEDDYRKPLPERQHYYVIWELDGRPVGHSNINQIFYGEEARMHLHLWQPESRRQGNGTYFVRQSVTQFFNKFELQKLYCEPYVYNPAPNHTMPKMGFELLETVHYTPGWLSFEQDVNRWIMTRERWFASQT